MPNPEKVKRDTYILSYDHNGSREAEEIISEINSEIKDILSRKLLTDDRFLDFQLGYDFTEDITDDYKEIW